MFSQTKTDPLWESLNSSIYNVNDGHVGIGTHSPVATLHIFDNENVISTNGSFTKCMLKITNKESESRTDDGFDIKLEAFNVSLQNHENGNIEIINKNDNGIEIFKNNSIVSTCDLFKIKLPSEKELLFGYAGTGVYLNSSSGILSISDGSNYQKLKSGKIEVFGIGDNNELLSLTNSHNENITLNYTTSGELIWEMNNAGLSNSGISFRNHGGISINTTNYPVWKTAYRVITPSDSEHLDNLMAFESKVGEQTTFKIRCDGYLRSESTIKSTELIVFDNTTNVINFKVKPDGEISTKSVLKSTGIHVGNMGGGYLVTNLEIQSDGTLISDSYLSSTGLKVYNSDDLNFDVNVDGEVRARKVTVNLDSWSDFVFKNDYKLMPLSDVEAYINAHKHLPGVPSEADVKTDGVDLAEMDKILLQKIEELTLYIIELEKEINELKKK